MTSVSNTLSTLQRGHGSTNLKLQLPVVVAAKCRIRRCRFRRYDDKDCAGIIRAGPLWMTVTIFRNMFLSFCFFWSSRFFIFHEYLQLLSNDHNYRIVRLSQLLGSWSRIRHLSTVKVLVYKWAWWRHGEGTQCKLQAMYSWWWYQKSLEMFPWGVTTC